MGPKKGGGKAHKAGGAKAKLKANERKVKRVVEDKTFGLKNKGKSKKVQNYVKEVQQAARQPKRGGGVRVIMPIVLYLYIPLQPPEDPQAVAVTIFAFCTVRHLMILYRPATVQRRQRRKRSK